MSEINPLQFLLSELQALNVLASELQSIADLNMISSWLKPTMTYASINYEQTYTTYQSVIENIVDRLHLVLNIVLIKLEEFTALRPANVRRPARLSMSSLSRIIMDKLSAFSVLQNETRKIHRDIHMQTDFAEAASGCGSCVVLFQCISNVENLFHDSTTFSRLKNARSEVRSRLFILNNSQSMRIMCDAIHADLRVFLDDYRALNESHAALKQQYDGLMNDFVNYTAECDAKFAQNEDALETLNNGVHTWRSKFSSELRLLEDSSTRISAECDQVERIYADKAAEADAILQRLLRRLEEFHAHESNMAAKMASATDMCAQRIASLQSQLRQAQLNASNLKACSAARTENDGNGVAQSQEACVPLAGSDPVEDMLQHIESNRLKIDYLQRENVALQRTIARIKMLVT